MRLRNIPRAESVLEACKEVVKDPESLRGNWNQTFKKEQPLHIEIGMGKGQFLLTLAAKNPQINYIGIERYSSAVSYTHLLLPSVPTSAFPLPPVSCWSYTDTGSRPSS